MIYTDHTNRPRTNCILMTEYKFRFFYIPKVACSGWKAVLRRKLGYENWKNLEIAHDRLNSSSGLKFAEPKEAIESPLPAYAMVRHPATRVLSAYLDKICSDEGNHLWTLVKKDIIEWLGKGDSLGEAKDAISFTDFLHWLSESNSPYVENEHWLPQTSLCAPISSLKIMGKFESFHEDSKRLMFAMGCNFSFPSAAELGWPSNTSRQNVESFFTEEARRLIYALYKEDFHRLNYSVIGYV